MTGVGARCTGGGGRVTARLTTGATEARGAGAALMIGAACGVAWMIGAGLGATGAGVLILVGCLVTIGAAGALTTGAGARVIVGGGGSVRDGGVKVGVGARFIIGAGAGGGGGVKVCGGAKGRGAGGSERTVEFRITVCAGARCEAPSNVPVVRVGTDLTLACPWLAIRGFIPETMSGFLTDVPTMALSSHTAEPSPRVAR